MSTFLKAMQTADSLTENGMATNSSSLNHCVDLFFQIGAMRGQDKQRLINAFTKAFAENPLHAMKLLFWARDIRGGAGERQIFRDIVAYLAENRTETLGKNLHLFNEYGRWDDLLTLVGTPLQTKALNLISDALDRKDGLVAKWMPRPNVSNREKKRWANVLRKHLGLTPKQYRKLLSENSNTVEQLMCAREYSKIEYSKLPSKAMSDYMKAFSKNGPAGGNPNVTCMDVAISLGLYISERNVGPFQDAFVTFSESPKLQILKGNLNERYNQLQRADWDMSTNLEAVFKLILKKATESNVPQSEMPTMILILSDMEFNSAVRGRGWNPTAQKMIETMYAEAGYKTPKVVYWNIQSRGDNNKPVHFDTNGTALVSGFSPALLTNLLAGKDLSPITMMLSVIDSERYSPVTI